jgi:hypothetical protein
MVACVEFFCQGVPDALSTTPNVPVIRPDHLFWGVMG